LILGQSRNSEYGSLIRVAVLICFQSRLRGSRRHALGSPAACYASLHRSPGCVDPLARRRGRARPLRRAPRGEVCGTIGRQCPAAPRPPHRAGHGAASAPAQAQALVGSAAHAGCDVWAREPAGFGCRRRRGRPRILGAAESAGAAVAGGRGGRRDLLRGLPALGLHGQHPGVSWQVASQQGPADSWRLRSSIAREALSLGYSVNLSFLRALCEPINQ
jgi:hypothetical protein